MDEATPPGGRSSVALVTGGGRGLGRAIAQTLSAAGVSVGLVGRDPGPLEEVVSLLAGPAFAVAADVTDPQMVARAVQAVEAKLGAVDLLVNGAGLRDPERAMPWQADPDAWWRVVEVNLRGPLLLTEAVLPTMLERGRGRILEMASGVGLRAEPGYSAYSVSKAALLRWVDNLAAGLGPDSGVRVLAASPGLVRTDMTEGMWEGLADSAYGSADAICAVARRFAAGDLDALHGWYVHAAKDDLDALLAVAGSAGEHARRLRLRGYGDDDPQA
ncbi:MAG TPA: SDR family oxidoreductase [Nocardioidaceae bacterium]|nr:SDR family oxidoreductase [Nocardioidaceae bacterium]